MEMYTYPIRVPKSIAKTVNALKAKKMLSTGRKISDGNIIAEAVEFAYQNEDKFLETPKIDFSKLIGTVSTGKGANATRDLDDVIYEGILDENRR
ncbi:MAG: hypothetical protein WC408_04150 [Candidatus Micrarchaeia archaeon]|jgi:hypothetical protein